MLISKHYLNEISESLKIQKKILKKFLKEINYECKSYQSSANNFLSLIYGFKNYHELQTLLKTNPYDYRFDFIILKPKNATINRMMIEDSIQKQIDRLIHFLKIDYNVAEKIIYQLHSIKTLDDIDLEKINSNLDFQQINRQIRNGKLTNKFHVKFIREKLFNKHEKLSTLKYVEDISNKNYIEKKLQKSKDKTYFIKGKNFLYVPKNMFSKEILLKRKLNLKEKCYHFEILLNFENILTLYILSSKYKKDFEFYSESIIEDYINHVLLINNLNFGKYSNLISLFDNPLSPFNINKVFSFLLIKRKAYFDDLIGYNSPSEILFYLYIKNKFTKETTVIVSPLKIIKESYKEKFKDINNDGLEKEIFLGLYDVDSLIKKGIKFDELIITNFENFFSLNPQSLIDFKINYGDMEIIKKYINNEPKKVNKNKRINDLMKIINISNKLLCVSNYKSFFEDSHYFFSIFNDYCKLHTYIENKRYDFWDFKHPLKSRGMDFNILIYEKELEDFLEMLPNNSLVTIESLSKIKIKEGFFKNKKGNYYAINDIKKSFNNFSNLKYINF